MNTSILAQCLSPIKKTSPVTIVGLGTATPPFQKSQAEILDFVLKHFNVSEATKTLYARTFNNKSIQKRAFGVDDLTEVMEKNHDLICHRFKKWAVSLSSNSLNQALEKGGFKPHQLDYLAVATCTGYLCPGLTSYLIEECHLRTDIPAIDIVGMGCGAALPTLEQATNFVLTHPKKTAAVVCTEICSAAFFSNNDPDIVISNTLFADGSAAVILKNQANSLDDNSNQTLPTGPCLRRFASLTVPEWRDSLRFRYEHGYLRNVLAKNVPIQAGHSFKKVIGELLRPENISLNEINHWVVHAGGEKVLESIQRMLGLSSSAFKASYDVLKNFGNMSSPTVLFVLKEHLAKTYSKPGDLAILCSFGAGFSAYAALMEF